MKKQEKNIDKGNKRKGEYRKCRGCDKELYYRPFEVQKGITRFCSHSCKAKVVVNKRKTGKMLTCLNCNNSFYAQYKEIQNNRKSCSPKCANELKIGLPLLSKRTGYNKVCKTCQKTFYVALWNQHQKYCSVDCYVSSEGIRYKANYNPDSIKIIESYGQLYGYCFKHALNGGEFRVPGTYYHVDAYDEKENVVLEIDENHHFLSDGTLKLYDIKRQFKIQEILKCKFIRIKI